MTQITVKQLAAAKRIAANVLPLTNKKAKLQAKIAEMEAEIGELNTQIDAQQGYVKSFANGLTTEQLVVRNENKAFEANPNVLTWDDTNRVWVVKEAVGIEEEFAGEIHSAKEEETFNALMDARLEEEERFAKTEVKEEVSVEEPETEVEDPFA